MGTHAAVTGEDPVDAVVSLLASAADVGYIGESVSQLSHALQCAALAESAGADAALVAAALLHDVGHLCGGPTAQRMGELGVLAHERAGARYLEDLGFPSIVTELVALHVPAKRYLAFKHPSYLARLSTASRGTLDYQGGPFDAAEAADFIARPAGRAALRLRAWDEAGKVPAWQGADLSHYRPLLRRVLAGRY